MATDSYASDSSRSERRFFSGMALAIIVVALAGFARTYFLRPVLPAPAVAAQGFTPLIHVHAFLFTSWVLVFFAQTRLVAAQRLDLHRRLGVGAAVLAALMLAVGTVTTLQGIVRGVAPFGLDPRRFALVPLFAIGLFAVFVLAGIRARRDPQSHKRLMLLATLAMLPPAIARWVLLLGLGPPLVFAVATLFLVPLVIWDFRTLRRLHPVTLWAGLLLAVSGPLRLALLQTDGWLAISNWLASLVA